MKQKTSRTVAVSRPEPGRAWLCLCFPELSLEVFPGSADRPFAVLGGERKQWVILACNAGAACQGVQAGMPVNAALALSPGLGFRARDPQREQEALQGLAAWAMEFTPVVSVDASGALLLEIGASAGLFGGIDALLRSATGGARERGHVVTTAVAPTARAALWLARAGQATGAVDVHALPGVLARLPVSVPGWPPSVREDLRRLGVTRLGEFMRLPRDGLARRIGAACLADLDEALGRAPEAREICRAPSRLRDGIDLPADTRESGPILEALRILLRRQERELRARQKGIAILWLGLRHRVGPETLLRIGLVRPSADLRHLEDLAALHLSATALAAPVVALRMEADLADAAPHPDEDLLGHRADPLAPIAALVERLRMRLGLNAVHGVANGRDHRPEHAWEVVTDPLATRRAPQPPPSASPRGQRPLWMLESPAPLRVNSGVPVFRGALTLESGPERVETGWWDGRDVRRDYYTATNPHGVKAWVFNDARTGGWYLHGLFG